MNFPVLAYHLLAQPQTHQETSTTISLSSSSKRSEHQQNHSTSMPTFADSGEGKSPCFYQKKSFHSGGNNNGNGAHVIPITKRPIDKVTTRSQAQYQLWMKTMGADALLENSKDRNNNNSGKQPQNGRQNSFITNNKYFVATSNATSAAHLNNGTATTREPTLAKTMTISSKRSSSSTQQSSSATSSTSNSSSATTTDNDVEFAEELVPTTVSLPYSPHKVLENTNFAMHLTAYEKKEILNYARIYFIGKKGIKKRTPNTPTVYPGADGFESKTVGFDDNNGSYIPVMHDHVAYRYEVQKTIGKGTFGVVLQAFDHKTQKNVALKIIRNQTRFHTQAREEIKILTKLLENDPDDKFNVVHMHENFFFRSHPCIVFELLSLNLFELSKKNAFHGFTLSLIRRFTYAIVKCLFALSKFSIIHCDLKPENILLKQQNRSGIKVIDFGSSCFSNKRVHTYIQSRYYRSPEVILCAKYGPSIDIWSLGCILAELYVGKPLLDGENEGDQLACMIELLDVPATSFLNKCKDSKVRQFFDSRGNPVYCARYCNGQYRPECGRSPRGKFRLQPGTRPLLPTCKDTDFVDFIRQCLIWDPAERMTPADALKHPWLSSKRSIQMDTDTSVYDNMT